jgi:hypothetical protein
MANTPAGGNFSGPSTPNVKVAVDLDADRFFNLLIGRLT